MAVTDRRILLKTFGLGSARMRVSGSGEGGGWIRLTSISKEVSFSKVIHSLYFHR
jgi:hypothetical protein